jgi:hypothetical protein
MEPNRALPGLNPKRGALVLIVRGIENTDGFGSLRAVEVDFVERTGSP